MAGLKLVVFLVAFALPACADILYQFRVFSSPSNVVGAFDALKPAFVLTPALTGLCPDPEHCVSTTDVLPGTCISCSPITADGQQFVALLDANDHISVFHGDILEFYNSAGLAFNYFFPVGAFSSRGTYSNNFSSQAAILIVSSDAPEPRTALLLALLFGASLVLRCERRQANKQRI